VEFLEFGDQRGFMRKTVSYFWKIVKLPFYPYRRYARDSCIFNTFGKQLKIDPHRPLISKEVMALERAPIYFLFSGLSLAILLNLIAYIANLGGLIFFIFEINKFLLEFSTDFGIDFLVPLFNGEVFVSLKLNEPLFMIFYIILTLAILLLLLYLLGNKQIYKMMKIPSINLSLLDIPVTVFNKIEMNLIIILEKLYLIYHKIGRVVIGGQNIISKKSIEFYEKKRFWAFRFTYLILIIISIILITTPLVLLIALPIVGCLVYSVSMLILVKMTAKNSLDVEAENIRVAKKISFESFLQPIRNQRGVVNLLSFAHYNVISTTDFETKWSTYLPEGWKFSDLNLVNYGLYDRSKLNIDLWIEEIKQKPDSKTLRKLNKCLTMLSLLYSKNPTIIESLNDLKSKVISLKVKPVS
jgi:hypothetical protein